MAHTISDSESDDTNEFKNGSSAPSVTSSQSSVTISKPRKRRTKEEIAAEKAAKLRVREEKQKEKEKRKVFKPGECFKFLQARVDKSLVENKQFGSALWSNLCSTSDLTVNVVPEAQIPLLPSGCGAIRWQRREHSCDQSWKDEPEVLVILSSNAFLDMTRPSNNSLSFDDIVTNLNGFGLRAVILVFGKINKKVSAGRSITSDLWHQTVVKTNLLYKLSMHLVENAEDMGRMVRCFTKSVAERELKNAARSSEAIFCTAGLNAPSVRVSEKDPQSFAKLWRQQLMQIRLVTGEIADAIVAVYRTPRALAEAYRQCESEAEARELLSDVQVRRGFGVLQTQRRVGKELSRRLYELMTCEDPQHVIH